MRMTSIISLSLLLAACSSLSSAMIEPGHVTPQMRYQLRVWMTHDQVREILGAPLVGGEANVQQWEYVYDTKEFDLNTGQLGNPVQQHLKVYFDGDRMARVDDGNQPVPEVVARPVVAKPAVLVHPPVAVEVHPALYIHPPIPSYQTGVLLNRDRSDDVRDAVENWQTAWETQDLQHYLGSYSPSYKPAGVSRKTWEAQRKKRIVTAETIRVEIDDLTIEMLSKERAKVEFEQTYHSESHHDVVRKMLELVLDNEQWRIVSETTKK
jgi:outer membrane protein assembly factor BamE (lipoprotein component of BamABCDE complex)/uncharacterized protein YchJ